MAITLTFTDHGDGTGSVSYTGGIALATYRCYTSPIGSSLSVSWTQRGSSIVATSGTFGPFALTPGPYLMYVKGTTVVSTEEVTVPATIRVTDGDESIHYRCLAETVSLIQLLALDGIDSSNVLFRKVPFERVTPAAGPAIYVTPYGAEEQPKNRGTNVSDWIGYPVLVTMIAADNQDLTANANRYLLWRERINKRFRNQKLLVVPEIWDCTVVPQNIVSATGWLENVWAGALLLRFTSDEGRGVT